MMTGDSLDICFVICVNRIDIVQNTEYAALVSIEVGVEKLECAKLCREQTFKNSIITESLFLA